MLQTVKTVGQGAPGVPGDMKFLLTPNVQLFGPIDIVAVRDCLQSIRAVRDSEAPLVFELTTEGGDAEGGRRIALEIRHLREHFGRETYFIGKTVVMSAGATIMSAFPRECRWLTADTMLLIHERRMQRTINLDGPTGSNLQIIRETLALLETAEEIEKQGFADLAQGSRLSADELYRRARGNYYLSAEQALELDLIAGVL
jgi:ATP-dependent protease ClpP protease subunit